MHTHTYAHTHTHTHIYVCIYFGHTVTHGPNLNLYLEIGERFICLSMRYTILYLIDRYVSNNTHTHTNRCIRPMHTDTHTRPSVVAYCAKDMSSYADPLVNNMILLNISKHTLFDLHVCLFLSHTHTHTCTVFKDVWLEMFQVMGLLLLLCVSQLWAWIHTHAFSHTHTHTLFTQMGAQRACGCRGAHLKVDL